MQTDTEIIDQLKKLNVAMKRHLFSIAKSDNHDTPPAPLQGAILHFLDERGSQTVTQSDIEAHFDISRATLSGSLDAMEKRGLIMRKVNEKDARSRIIELTQKGFDEVTKSYAAIANLQTTIIQGISPGDLSEFKRIIGQMYANLKRNDQENK